MNQSVAKNLLISFRSRLLLALGFLRLPEHVICSPGGVATTPLLNYCSQFVSINSVHDLDGLKHLPSPRLLRHSKVIYISGKTRHVVPSLRRRGFSKSQIVKLSGNPLALLIPKIMEDPILRILIRRQRKRFTIPKSQVLIIRDENLYQSAREIATFLGITDAQDFVDRFPIYERVR